MDYLLDTHILLWALLEPSKLSSNVIVTLEDPENTLWISPITLWEILILVEKKRIQLDMDPESWIREIIAQVPIKEAPLNHEVAIESRKINLSQQDPADRFIAATAKVYDLILLTADKRLLECSELNVQG